MARRRRSRSERKLGLSGSILAFLLAFVLIVPAAPLSAGPEDFAKRFSAVTGAPRYQYARWGACVVDLASGETLYTVNADTLFAPASVTKLFTAAAALDVLGRGHAFQTAVYRQGTVDKSGTLRGDIILVPSGDFYLSDLGSLARQVRASGIRGVAGDVVVDDRLFGSHAVYSVSRPGRLLYVLSPAAVRDNQLEVTVRPTRPGKAAVATAKPSGSWVRMNCRARTVGRSEPVKIDVIAEGAGRIIVDGRIPEHSPAVTRRVPVADPPSHLRALLITALKQTGVRIRAAAERPNRADLLPAPDAYGKTASKVAERLSPPLSDYVCNILKTSHNEGADMLPLVLAAKIGKDRFADGMAAERAFFTKTGIDLRALSLSDGSGISTANLVTPRTVVQLLTFMTTHKDYEVFRGGLPVLGVDGTLAGAGGEGSPARGRIAAKTGTMDLFDLANDSGFVQIKSLAGYMTAASGRQMAFALFVNHVHGVDAPDHKAVMKLTADVGADLARAAELLYQSF